MRIRGDQPRGWCCDGRAFAQPPPAAKRTVLTLLLLLAASPGIDARQNGVQRFDQPIAGARSPRNANYEIDVTLDHGSRTLAGRAVVRWRNISANPTSELQFHLYWNAWRDPESTWLRERRLAGNFTPPRADAWGSMDVSTMRVRGPMRTEALAGFAGAAQGGEAGTPWTDVTSIQRFVAPDDGNAADRTVMVVPLPFSVGPHEGVEIEVEWTAKVPRPFARTGYVGDYYFIAQWFPKVGVLEDGGWNTHQFHAATEFYSDYGVYDVRITVPRRFVVGASGVELDRASAGGDLMRHRYRGEDIHDFAWTASPRFREARRPFDHPGLPRVEMRLLLQPEHAGQEARHFDATAAALRYYGEWFGPYPYDHITIVDPAYQSGSGGMEYPTLFTAGSRWIAPAAVSQPERVTIHEAGHQFWYGLVANNEFEHAWLDEGLNTFSEARAAEEAAIPNRLGLRFFGGFIPWVLDDIRFSRATDGNRLPGYRDNAEADVPATPTFRYWPGTAAFISYNKTALWLHTLERHLGWPVLRQVLATYFERWSFRHPRPEDFFGVVGEVTGRDLSWFFDEAYRSSNVFDYGVQSLTSSPARLPPASAHAAGQEGVDSREDGYRTVVVARRFGEAVFPVDVVTTFRDGERITERWDGRERRAIYTYERPSQALSVEIDPERVLLLDVNYTNNSVTLEPRSREAALKWALTWLAWLQTLMLTYAFFV